MPGRDQRRTNVAYYQRNRDQEVRRIRRRQDVTRDYLRHRRDQPCVDCGDSFRAHQMDFDHRDPSAKSFRLTAGRAMLMPRARLDAEIAKCDVVCANCHRVRTRLRSQALDERRLIERPSDVLVRKRRYWRSQARMLDGLKQGACADCGRRYRPFVIDFDHRDPGEKEYTVSRMIGRAGDAKIMAEVAKCDIVCANCHRDRTYRRREAGSS